MNKKHNSPSRVDMGFEETLAHFSQVEPGEANDKESPVTLYEDDTGARFLIYSGNQGETIELRYEEE